MIIFTRVGFAIVSESHGLERGCDQIFPINTPICIYVVIAVNSKHKINHYQEKKPHNNIS